MWIFLLIGVFAILVGLFLWSVHVFEKEFPEEWKRNKDDR